MSDRALRIYHSLPSPARSAAASLRGLYLRSWRYGPQTEKLVAEALERDSWSAARWEAWRSERIARLLHRAATRVPYYRSIWAERRRAGDRRSWDLLENWPLLSKETVRSEPERLVADDRNPRRMFPDHTSGTTGAPVHVWWSRECVRAWYALFEARARIWNGVSRSEPWAIVGGQAVVPAEVSGPPFWVHNLAMRQIYLSANHICRRNTPAFLEALARHGATHLVAYSSCAADLAGHAIDLGLRVPRLKAVITNAEPLYPWQRELIQSAFGGPARETYGMVEIGAGASECAAGAMHLWPEVGWIEVFDDSADSAASAGEVGRLVCTGLLNTDMPLIRYVVGDRGRGISQSAGCPCGRALPILSAVEGRIKDELITPDGRRIYWLNNAVFAGIPIREAQLVQDRLEEVRVLYVPASGFGSSHATLLRDRIRARMGSVEVRFEPMAEIPRGSNGKFRPVICSVAVGDRKWTRAEVASSHAR